VVVAAGEEKEILGRIVRGETVGTLFLPELPELPPAPVSVGYMLLSFHTIFTVF
jgi:hypothetical protein